MTTETFLGAAEAFADLVDRLPRDLVGPGLGEWDLRALVGHTSRSLITVSTYLGRPAERVDLEAAADYLAGMAQATQDAAVVERGRVAGEALGTDAGAACRRLLETVADDLVAASPDLLITTIGGGMRLRDYLPTRTFELVVHGLDIAAATGLDWSPPADALARVDPAGRRGRRTSRRGLPLPPCRHRSRPRAHLRHLSVEPPVGYERSTSPEWWNWQTRRF